MKVRLAAQVLSSSVEAALNTLRETHVAGFEGSKATAEFCGVINNVFDVLNCRNFQSRAEFCKPMDLLNIFFLRDHIMAWIRYLATLTTNQRDLIIHCRRKTGFLGFIIDLSNLLDYAEELVSRGSMKFVLSYKLSQDHLELFFGSIRARGGYNNNPSALNFKTAYKRLLVKHQLAANKSGNCTILEATTILHIGSGAATTLDVIVEDETFMDDAIAEDSLDYAYLLDCLTGESLSAYVKDVVGYIAGFVVRRVISRISCKECGTFLKATESTLVLLKNKQRGGLICAHADVISLCFVLERLLRENQHVLLHVENITNIIVIKANKFSSNIFIRPEILEHIRNPRHFRQP